VVVAGRKEFAAGCEKMPGAPGRSKVEIRDEIHAERMREEIKKNKERQKCQN